MRVFQTFLVPDALVSQFKLSFAASNFSRNLKNADVFDKVYSLLPVTVSGELPEVVEEGYTIVYSLFRRRGPLFAKSAIFLEQWMVFRQLKKNDYLWLYNLNIMNVLLFILCKIFKPSIGINVILLDFTPPLSWRNDNFWYLKLINMADGVISLSDSKLFRVKNRAVLPGLAPRLEVNKLEMSNLNKEFLLSGVISPPIASTSMVLEAFSGMPDCILHITGTALEQEDLISEYAEKYSNIVYHGTVTYETYLSILHRVTYQLSTRDENYPENQCNFPSKIIESLLHNRIVISTISYKQLDGIMYFKVDSECNAFKTQINEICSIKNEVLIRYANQGAITTKKFGARVWKNTIEEIENFSK